jgi:hypothetical protein
VDPQHLQRIIEKQPSCLVRAGIDGVLLAVNDAALGLLGAREIGQVLGTPLTARIVPEHHELWKAFAATIATDASRSFECDLTDLTGARRTILFHGVPLLDHPDGIPSMMLGARDVSALRRLETAQETQSRRQTDQSRQQAASSDRDQLQQLLMAGRKHLETQRVQLAEVTAERQRLQTLLQERETAHQRLIDEQTALQGALSEQQRLNVQSAADAAQQLEDLRTQLIQQHQLDLQSAEAVSQQLIDGLRTQLTEAAANRQRLETELVQRDVQLIDELAAERSRFDGVLAGSAVKQREMAQALADQGVELHYVELTAKQLAPLAVTGRLALELGAELQSIVEAMDARAAALLVDCPLEAACREAVEALRGDAIRLRSLIRQLERASADAQTVSYHS